MRFFLRGYITAVVSVALLFVTESNPLPDGSTCRNYVTNNAPVNPTAPTDLRRARVQYLSKQNTVSGSPSSKIEAPVEDPCQNDEELARLLQEEENSMPLWNAPDPGPRNVFQAVCAGAGRLLSNILPPRSGSDRPMEPALPVLPHSTQRPEQQHDDSEYARRIQEEEWVAVADAISAEVRLYDRLFTDAQPDAGGKDFIEGLNPNSLKVVRAVVEPSLTHAKPDDKFQFERLGYFVADRVDHKPGKPVFNLAVGLRDGWGK